MFKNGAGGPPAVQSQLVPVAAGTSRCWHQSLLAAVAAGTSRCWHQSLLAPVAAGTSKCINNLLKYKILCDFYAFLVKIHGHRWPKGLASALGRLGPGRRGARRGAREGAAAPGKGLRPGQTAARLRG